MEEKYTLARAILMDEQMGGKFILDIDGNGWINRFMPSIKYGSLILKATYYTEYPNPFLKPGVHFLPITRDYSDLT